VTEQFFIKGLRSKILEDLKQELAQKMQTQRLGIGQIRE